MKVIFFFRTGKPRVLPDSPFLSPYFNRLRLARSDIPYLDMKGPDIEPNR